MAPEPPHTIQGLLAAGKTKLLAPGDSAARDAQVLLEHVTGFPRSLSITAPETTVPVDTADQYARLIARRSHGEPVAYLTGQREFWSLTLTVNPAVLVPRPETELLVERALLHPGADARVLDLGTGSGAIALAIARERPGAQVTAVDISAAALAVARENAHQLGIANVEFHAGSWFEPVARRQYSMIVSNPPYIAHGDPDLDAAVLAHEPQLALISGASGYEAIATIVASAPDHLENGGWLLLEHGWRQGAHVRAMLEKAGFAHVVSHADLAGHERVTEGQRP